MKQLTPKQIAKYESKIIETAINWKNTRNMNAEQLAVAIWNKFGYSTATKGEKVQIWANRKVIAEI